MTDSTFNNGLKEVLENPWASGDYRVLLLEQNLNLEFNRQDVFIADVLARADNVEASGQGYARKALSGKVITLEQANNRVLFDHDDVTYTAIDVGELGVAIYYRSVTTDADSPVIFWKDSGFPFLTAGDDMSIRLGSNGLVATSDVSEAAGGGMG